ncbi:MAG: hypothetical protein PHN39_02595 [Candidatus Pacebacteria bacterium]|nr:hypothetical protein [Candidatus Paceibacterota bacterium]
MKKKILLYSLFPALILGFVGVNAASAHGWFEGFTSLDPDQMAAKQQTMFQNEADLLGISIGELKDAWAEGKTLAQIAQEKGITQQQLQDRMKQKREEQQKSYLKALVDKGVITQAQADKRLQFMEQQSSNKGVGKGMRFHGMLKGSF